MYCTQRIWPVLGLALAILTPVIEAGTIRVPADQPTIQAAINAAVNGDEVLVAAGSYNEVINFLGKAITVQSEDGPSVTTISGAGKGDAVVSFLTGEGRDSVIEGFTLRDGIGNNTLFPGSRNGGGIIISTASPTVNECIVTANSTNSAGGGVAVHFSGEPVFSNCIFLANTAAFAGGAVAMNNSAPTFVNCLFNGNQVNNQGGAIQSFLSRPTFTNCSVINNTGGDGGGIWISGPDVITIVNCIFWANNDNGVDVSAAQVFIDIGAPVVLFSDVMGGWSGAGHGNISSDPMFADLDGVDNSPGNADDDLRLLAGSPAIDAGISMDEPDADLDGNMRIVDDPASMDTGVGNPVVIDMGTYEFGSTLLPDPCPADTNGDGNVNVTDLLALLAAWGACP
ncbi:MAG: hypothetical protein IID30_13195 [Planctomycetes bacterium]|nr:hypothetical protein [Planctomycetota bacterium]